MKVWKEFWTHLLIKWWSIHYICYGPFIIQITKTHNENTITYKLFAWMKMLHSVASTQQSIAMRVGWYANLYNWYEDHYSVCVRVWVANDRTSCGQQFVTTTLLHTTSDDDELPAPEASLLYEIAVGVYSFDCQIRFSHNVLNRDPVSWWALSYDIKLAMVWSSQSGVQKHRIDDALFFCKEEVLLYIFMWI